MTISTDEWAEREVRIRVIDDRVECPRVGTVEIDRCRECVYLLRLETAGQQRTSEAFVLCASVAADPLSDIADMSW
jgi:hypothetical protein